MTHIPQPPGWARRFLNWYCASDYIQEVEGDLNETFEMRCLDRGVPYARLMYFLDVLRFFRPYIILGKSGRRFQGSWNLPSLLNHYFRSFFRRFNKSRGLMALNFFGFVVGLVASILIFQYVHFERNYDRFHARGEDLHRVKMDFVAGGDRFSYATNFRPVGSLLEKDYPEVEAYGLLAKAEGGNLYTFTDEAGALQRRKLESVYFASQGFWNLFSFKLVAGDPLRCLTTPDAAIISETTALRFFGHLDVLGKRIIRNGEASYVVQGVYEDVPANSHLQFDVLLALDRDPPAERLWRSYDTYLYLRLQAGTDHMALNESLKTYLDKYREKRSYDTELSLQPLNDIHFDENTLEDIAVKNASGNVNFLYYMAWSILVISWVNFANFFNALATTRGMEAAVRNVFGSNRFQSLIQHISESLLATGLAMVLAAFIAHFGHSLLYPLMSVDVVPFSWDLGVWWPYLLIFGAGSVLGGLFSHTTLRAFKASVLIKGRGGVKTKGGAVRKAFMVVQFGAAFLLLAFTFMVNRQVHFLQSAALGIDIERTIVVENPSMRDSTIFTRLQTFKNEVRALSSVQDMAYAQDVPGRHVRFSFGGIRPVGQDDGKQYQVTNIEPDFADFYELEFLAGRNVTLNPSDLGKVYINETALYQLGISSPKEAIGVVLTFPRAPVEIVGVVKDFHMASVKDLIEPIIFHYRPHDWPFGLDHALVRVGAGELTFLLEEMEKAYLSLFPQDVFEYYFLDTHFQQQFENDRVFMRLFGVFSLLSIVIAGMGLTTLITFTLNTRIKELGIRQYLGAGRLDLMLIFIRYMSELLLVAAGASLPMAFWIGKKYLEGFARQVDWAWWDMALPATGLVLLTLVVVSVQTHLKSRGNLIEALRDDS